MNETNTGLIAFNQLPQIAGNANEVLAKNKNFHDKALAKAQGLLDTIDAEGMTDELDAECNKFLANCIVAKDKMNAGRAPITQLFTAIAKEFTTLENPFDKAKPGTFAYNVQEARNNYARQKEAEARKKEDELRRQRAVEEEKISIKAKVEQIVRDKYNSILFAFKKKYNDRFNELTLDNYKEIDKELQAMKVLYPRDKFNEILVPVTSNYLDAATLAPIIFDAKVALYEELSDDFTKQMDNLKHYLSEQIPARKFELEEIAKAGKAEAKRLEDAAKLRKQEEELRLERERQDNEKKAADQIRLNAEVNQAQLSFEQDVQHAELRTDQAAVKHSYCIKVMTAIGYQQIAALWFKEFGSKTPLDKLEKKTLGSMKGDLEKLAFNGGERLNDSGHLCYESDIKAVTKAVK